MPFSVVQIAKFTDNTIKEKKKYSTKLENGASERGANEARTSLRGKKNNKFRFYLCPNMNENLLH